MEIKVASIVRSIAGRDKGRLFLTVALEGEYAYVSDGKLRKIEKPKKKKIKHLQGTDYVFSGEFSENYQIRDALAKYQKTV